jgi:hypothetical protein
MAGGGRASGRAEAASDEEGLLAAVKLNTSSESSSAGEGCQSLDKLLDNNASYAAPTNYWMMMHLRGWAAEAPITYWIIIH